MIELGLGRIAALLKNTPQSWKAVHVAGTNGKGSICAYVHAMVRSRRVSCGRFTSPHLVDRWDCVAIDDGPVPEARFRHFEALVRARDVEGQVGASEFELLAATAFELFEAAGVEVGVVEVGLGGRLDATNALRDKAVAVVASISIDHQAFLGDELEDIALQKAGIMRPGVPCVVDPSNPPRVLDVLRAHADEVGASLRLAPDPQSAADLLGPELTEQLEPHQQQNLLCAYEAFRLACPDDPATARELLAAGAAAVWPGRLQSVDVAKLTGRSEPVLMDGAHNPQSAEVLSAYVGKRLRANGGSGPVTWLLAASAGKDITEILKILLRDGDHVVAVEFGPVDGMPWVSPTSSATILRTIDDLGISLSSRGDARGDVLKGLGAAAKLAQGGGPLVVAGSLYLVSDILRLLRA
ncbi:folylpolyglutamate synthase-like protein [Nemania sp. NC0429]|nr:folylpolyglutamate synthase-like protein [Nemania sp. NC0429]